MIRQARELRARGERPECTKMRFCLFGCMHGKRTCQLTPPTSPRVQVSKFKQAYEERKKVLQLGEQNSLLMPAGGGAVAHAICLHFTQAAGKSSAGSLFAFGDVAKVRAHSWQRLSLPHAGPTPWPNYLYRRPLRRATVPVAQL